MLRLLLPEEKKQVRREYLKRLAVIACYGLVLVIIAWVAALIPTYVLVHSEKEVLTERLRVATDETLTSERATLKKELQNVSRKLTLLDTPEYQISRIVRALTEPQGRSIAVSTMQVITTPDPETRTLAGVVAIQGIASNRAALVAYVDTLKRNTELFVGVDLPFSSFARDADIPFSITIELVPMTQTS